MSVRSSSSDNVKAMKKGFMKFHELGMSVMEIANIYGVSRTTAYSILQEIADANEVSREELLDGGAKPSKTKEEFQSALNELSAKEVLELADILLSRTKALIDHSKKRLEETINGK